MGNFELVREGLHLGFAKGNRFEITLRALQAQSLSDVAAAAEAVRTNGFINYYGLQRFGTGGAATHRLGAAAVSTSQAFAVCFARPSFTASILSSQDWHPAA